MDEDSCGENNTTDDEWQAPKRLALHDSNIPRYKKEFVEMSLIGRITIHHQMNIVECPDFSFEFHFFFLILQIL